MGESIAERVRQIVADRFHVHISNISNKTRFSGDEVGSLGADSLDVVELAMEIEEKFGITIDDDDVHRLTTVGELITFVERSLR